MLSKALGLKHYTYKLLLYSIVFTIPSSSTLPFYYTFFSLPYFLQKTSLRFYALSFRSCLFVIITHHPHLGSLQLALCFYFLCFIACCYPGRRLTGYTYPARAIYLAGGFCSCLLLFHLLCSMLYASMLYWSLLFSTRYSFGKEDGTRDKTDRRTCRKLEYRLRYDLHLRVRVEFVPIFNARTLLGAVPCIRRCLRIQNQK